MAKIPNSQLAKECYIAFLFRLWNIQIPTWFFKIKSLFIEKLEKITIELHEGFIFKEMSA